MSAATDGVPGRADAFVRRIAGNARTAEVPVLEGAGQRVAIQILTAKNVKTSIAGHKLLGIVGDEPGVGEVARAIRVAIHIDGVHPVAICPFFPIGTLDSQRPDGSFDESPLRTLAIETVGEIHPHDGRGKIWVRLFNDAH